MEMSEHRPLLGELGDRLSVRRLASMAVAATAIFALGVTSSTTLRSRGLFWTAPTQKTPVLSEVEETKSPMKPVKVTTQECAGNRKLPVLQGADTVAYFSLQPGARAVFGSDEHRTVFNGYAFLFASRENQLIFENDPEHYIPQWGGFCSYGIAHEIIWMPDKLGPPSDPNNWVIVPGGKLHLFRSPTPRAKFMKDMQVNLEHGSHVWNDWFGEHGHRSHPVPFNTACFCSSSTCEDG